MIIIIIIIIIIIKLRCQIFKFVDEVYVQLQFGRWGWFNFCHVRLVAKSMLDALLRLSHTFYIR